MKTDIEIARNTPLVNIEQIAQQAGIPAESVNPYGRYMAKIDERLIDDAKVKESNLILVTAITPTKAGIGKTTVSIGLALGLNKIGKKTMVALREPSLGPCFGMKGGAAGGGYTQVLPMDKINLHFTGDFHAITSANNMIAALLDNYMYQNRDKGIGLKEVLWRRVLDVNDRSLRYVVTGLGPKTNGFAQEAGFDITPASEIMAILCLATDENDLRRRIENILLGFTYEGKPFTVKDLGVAGAITVLLKDAISPNLVQTTENTPAIVHGGPFANIAHGCNSVMATKLSMKLGDYAINEAGFGADLGAEKFLDIKCRQAGLKPDAVVIVATVRALKMHGGVAKKDLGEENLDALGKGIENLEKHIENIAKYNLPSVVAINAFPTDTDAELQLLNEICQKKGVEVAISQVWAKGADGGIELAEKLLDILETKEADFKPIYELDIPIDEKVRTIAKEIYGADDVIFTKKAATKMKKYTEQGLENLPICIAKTQYSLSDDASLLGRPEGFTVTISDLIPNTGAGFLVAIAGDIMRMPGLPKVPAAVNMDIDENGTIVGLF